MWAAGYLARLPRTSTQPVEVYVPSGVLVALLLICLLAGGFVAGRYTERGVRGGLYVGLLAGLLNMLVLGSLLSGGQPNSIAPAALAWMPASFALAAVLGMIGAAIGGRVPCQCPEINWTGPLAKVAVAATLLLLIAGGLVTSQEAGLAVVDWPNSFGYSMFLYPLSRMSGGIYYEHAHRLFGTLVGLTTLVLAVQLG